jgi:cytochrome c-type biogenesis protein CcmF
MFGKIIIYLLAGTAIASVVVNALAAFTKEKPILKKIGDILYFALFFFVALAGAMLMTAILNHNFSFAYVYNNSSLDMPFYLLVSSFFAGQEGSYLLWAIFIAAVALVFRSQSKKLGIERSSMALISLMLVFIGILLIFKNPFIYVWEAFPNAAEGMIPKDGRSLNPVLENFWMAIHPPVLFAGYAMLSIVFAITAAGFGKEYKDSYLLILQKWTLAASAVLGIGIALGGFWAYETLGWGGFWGWDPVENSSLLPWLAAVALLHTIIAEKRTSSLGKTNYFLAVISFLLVLAATFLARSGVLSKVSVHSFNETAGANFYILASFFATFLFIGIIFFVRHSIKKTYVSNLAIKPDSRTFLLLLGAIATLFLAAITMLGTIVPLFSSAAAGDEFKIETKFYNDWSLPIVFIMLLLNAAAYYFRWKETDFGRFLKKLLLSLLKATIFTTVAYFLGANNTKSLFIIFISALTLNVAIETIIRKRKKDIASHGGAISHAGIALLLFGIAGTGFYSVDSVINLPQNTTKQALGYDFTYTGSVIGDTTDKHKEIYIHKLKIGSESDTSNIVTFLSSFNDWSELYAVPLIKSSLTNDLYITFNALTNDGGEKINLNSGVSKPVPIDSSKSVTLVGFDNSQMMHASNENRMELGAIIETIDNASGAIISIDTLFAVIDIRSLTCDPQWTFLPTGYIAGFTGFMPDENVKSGFSVTISFKRSCDEIDNTQALTLHVEKKPFVLLVWSGFILINFGIALAAFKKPKA